MARWFKQVRFVMIAVAGFVLLVTVLPQVASGIGLGSLANRLDATINCSGSSGSSGSTDGSSSSDGSGSSGCNSGPGTVSGQVSVIGAPVGFYPGVLGGLACPYVSANQPLCTYPQFNFSSYGHYSLSLNPGNWVVYGFYETNYFSGLFLGAPHLESVGSGDNLSLSTTVPYAKPASVNVTIGVTGLPAGITVNATSVVLCPAGVPYDGIVLSNNCVQGSSGNYPPSPTPGVFTISNLPAGQWTAYPGYCTLYGCVVNPKVSKSVTTVAGRTARVHLTTPYLVPPNGQLTTTVSVSGAPAGFNDSVGFIACRTTSNFTSCNGGSGSPNSVILGDGIWTVSGFYVVAPFGNYVMGPAQNILIQGGQTTSLALDVPYQVLGTASGTIKIAGIPANVHPTSYSISACPVGGGNPFNFISCVYEYSSTGNYSYGAADTKRLGRSAQRGTLPKAAGVKINTFDLTTLTPGLWDIQVSYQTQFGYFSPQNDTVVNVTAGKTTTTTVKIPYQVPTFGIVKGTLSVVNLAGPTSTTVRACSSDPSAGICTNEVEAYVYGAGPYQLQLAPGTWWVQGVAYNYVGPTVRTTVTTPKQVSVTDGSQSLANFTITGP
jgi:hypothetical protein